MSRSRLFGLLPAAIFATGAFVACVGSGNGGASSSGGFFADAGAGDAAAVAPGLTDEDRPLIRASKVDVLLVVDNSASMFDKSTLLAGSIGTLIRDVARVGDVHVGVVSSSLGNMGGDICDPTNFETNGRGHLRTWGEGGAAIPGMQNGVLAFTGGNVDGFVTSVQSLVRGVGQVGCGLEAQLENAYRFLVQPDPWDVVKLDSSNLADLGEGVDADLLVQRKAFLRPDSALIVLMLTDEDDSSADPLAVGGQGWSFMAKNFPGSKVSRGSAAQGTTAPRGTSTCASAPGSADCTSCGFASLCDPSTAACQKLKQDPNCTVSGVPGQSGDGYNGYSSPEDDPLNVRFHRMKQRFGIDPQFPISRYVDGFSKSVVPNRKSEHVTTVANGRRAIAPYTGTPNCTNPIFAASLPSSPGDELCQLPRGSRSRELVVFGLLGGVPEGLASGTPDWTKIVGKDPDQYDYTGIDIHMVQSTTPRPGLTGATSPIGDNGSDPINGREWDTKKNDLQYACTFPLPKPKNCFTNDSSCDCTPESTVNPPLCSSSNVQTRGKAYPTPRPLRVVRGLGERGVVGSICSSNYDTTMKTLSARLATRLVP